MLFDLRGRGRRRTIQGIYLFLALLMGGGLVFFGVGGTGVGLFNNDNNGGSNSGGGKNPITARLKAAQRQTRLQPTNPNAWANLTRQTYTDASSGDNYDQNTHRFTASGIAELRQSDAAFQRYLALKPAKLDTGLVALMTAAYGEGGLNNPKKASSALEALTVAQPNNAGAFAQLAVAAFQAGQTRKSALAEQKAIDLTKSKSGKKAMKAAIDGQKAQTAQGQQQPQTSTQLPGG
jgi:hypothetical protein